MFLSLAFAAKLGTDEGVGPIQKVIQLVEELEAEVLKEGEEGAAAYEEFTDWCKEQAIETKHSLADAAETIEELNAEEEAATALITKLAAEIGGQGALDPGLTGKISAAEQELQEADAIRAKEKEAFTHLDTDLAETIDMVTRAHKVLEENLGKLDSALVQASLTQLTATLSRVIDSSTVGLHNAEALASLLQAHSDSFAQEGEPGSATKAVLEVLQEMLDHASETRAAAQKEEMERQHQFDIFAQAENNQLTSLKGQLATAKKRMNLNSEKKANAEKGLLTVTKEKSETEQYRSDTQQKCLERAADWEQASAERAEEMNTLAQAKAILSNQGKPAGVDFTQTSASAAALSFVQVARRASGPEEYARQLKAAEFLRKESQTTGSWVLAQLSDKVSADPFGSVRQMVQEMIDKLTEEQASEAEHKAWCDEEMGKTKKSQKKMGSKVKELQTRSEKGQADSTSLQEEIQSLSESLQALDSSTKEALKLRQDEAAAWAKAKKEHTTGQEAVAAAMKVLRQYYEGKSFLQAGAAARAEAATRGPAGIIGLLEVAEADFAKSLAEGQAAEDAAQEEFEKLAEDARIQKASMIQDSKNKKAELSRVDAMLAQTSEDLADAQKELAAVVEYLEKVSSTCQTKTPSHEERQARRAKEIESLQTALGVLEGTDLGFLQRSLRQ